LKRGVSIQAANAEVGALAQSLEQAHPETNRAYGAAVRTELQARMDDDSTAGPLQGLLLGLVMLLLVIACANVTNLMLSRGRSRAREVALRLAIGASRGRLVRQLMVENLLMACAGGGLGSSSRWLACMPWWRTRSAGRPMRSAFAWRSGQRGDR